MTKTEKYLFTALGSVFALENSKGSFNTLNQKNALLLSHLQIVCIGMAVMLSCEFMKSYPHSLDLDSLQVSHYVLVF